MQRDGRLLADVRAAELRGQDVVPEARRVPEPQGDEQRRHEVQLTQTHHRICRLMTYTPLRNFADDLFY